MVWTWGRTGVHKGQRDPRKLAVRIHVAMTCRISRGWFCDIVLFVYISCCFFLRIQSHGIHHHSSPPCVEHVCLQPTKKQIQAIETRKNSNGLSLFEQVPTCNVGHLLMGNIAQGSILQFGENLGLGNVLFLFFSIWSFYGFLIAASPALRNWNNFCVASHLMLETTCA